MDNETNAEFYVKAIDYWSKIPPTIDGMLGGFSFISQKDIQGSTQFLNELFRLKKPPGKKRALDCGSGIGRITKNLLIPIFDEIDMIDQDAHFIEGSDEYIGDLKSKVRKQYVMGLQNFVPDHNTYDVIWCQWVLGHLRDDHLLNFFNCCKNSLRPNGILVVKENITSSGDEEIDSQDSSVTRSEKLFLKLFLQSGLRCIKRIQQTNFPKGLYAVHIFALKPLKKKIN